MYGPAQEIFVHITSVSSEGLDEAVLMSRLNRTFISHIKKSTKVEDGSDQNSYL